MEKGDACPRTSFGLLTVPGSAAHPSTPPGARVPSPARPPVGAESTGNSFPLTLPSSPLDCPTVIGKVVI